MYSSSTNITAVRSRHIIADALFSLMEHTHFNKITITALCEKAGVGRKTFYRNFELKEDVIEFQLDNMREEYRKGIIPSDTNGYLYHHFSYIRNNADRLILLYKNGFSSLINEKFMLLLPEMMPLLSADPVEQEYRSSYIVSGIKAVEYTYVKRGCTEPVEQVVEFVMNALDKQVPV